MVIMTLSLVMPVDLVLGLSTPPSPPGCNLQLHFVLPLARRPPSTQVARVKKEENILFGRADRTSAAVFALFFIIVQSN